MANWNDSVIKIKDYLASMVSGQTTGNASLASIAASMEESTTRATGIAHRSGIVAADKCVPPTLATKAAVNSVGSLLATTYYVAVSPGTVFGPAGASNILSQACSANDALDLTVPQVSGATFYDVFCSANAAPLGVCRITETQRAAGAKITAVGTCESPSSGVSAGVVRIAVPGTGIATSSVPFSANNAYVLGTATGVDCAGKRLAYIHVDFSVTDLLVAPSLTLAPVLESNETPGKQYTTTSISVWIANGSAGQTMRQSLEPIEIYGATKLYILVGSIAGTGASCSVWVELV